MKALALEKAVAFGALRAQDIGPGRNKRSEAVPIFRIATK
jgi:hypothetical protein